MEVTFENFFLKTEAIFKGCRAPKREPNFISLCRHRNRKGISSQYWYGEDSKGQYVIRQSDHWARVKKLGEESLRINCYRVAGCFWHLITTEDFFTLRFFHKEVGVGKCYLKNFKKIPNH